MSSDEGHDFGSSNRWILAVATFAFNYEFVFAPLMLYVIEPSLNDEPIAPYNLGLFNEQLDDDIKRGLTWLTKTSILSRPWWIGISRCASVFFFGFGQTWQSLGSRYLSP